jgi:DNA-binding PadR family transcriptional regulator
MDLGDFKHFTDPSILILSSLAGGSKHGYGMMVDIETMTGIRLGPGTLYGALARLESSGLIEAGELKDRRRPYHLTRVGIQALREQLSLLEKLAATGLKRLAME